MRSCLLVAVLAVLLLALTANAAQPGGWEQEAGFELLFNQGYYSPNWAGDEKTSGALTASIGHRAQRQFTGVLRLEHELELAFGQQLTRNSATWTASKSEDKLNLDELLRFTLGLWVDPLVLVQARSQFLDGRDPQETQWFNPVQLLEAAGFGRKFFDDEVRTLTSEFGAAARQVFDRLDTLTVSDAGLSWTTAYRTRFFSPNAGYATRLALYKPLVAFGTDTELGTLPQADWRHELSARFNKVLSGKVFAQVLFDDRVDDTPRLKQTLGLGLSLAWPATAEQE
ncbi:MAG TPA: DUF3078 domain-containing protein [candidate division WOR-3 bacterium]|uniref:DUF3078 domain-containing protein n=1 Tax=candidate division WOR-3 bacterium TaxID=2052148 RepID=A0A7V0T4E4_UNCW3|nr:DUF3078 domain-containing protein [candidate division WOR-3 bacterium]